MVCRSKVDTVLGKLNPPCCDGPFQKPWCGKAETTNKWSCEGVNLKLSLLHTEDISGKHWVFNKPTKTSHFCLHFLVLFYENLLFLPFPWFLSFSLKVCSTSLCLFNELSSGRELCPGTGFLRIERKVVCHLKGKEEVSLHHQRLYYFTFKKKCALSTYY